MTFVRAFKELGIESFRKQLEELRADPSKEPQPLWRDDSLTEIVSGNAEVESRDFATKFEFGRYAVERFSGKISDRVLRSTPGLWSWLASFYLPQLCPIDSPGRRKKPLGDEKYISSSTDIRIGMDKHLLFFPWKLVSIHGEKAEWALSPALGIDSKVLRELATSYRRNVSPEYLLLARRMYFDETKQAIRRGATSHNRPGNLRRLKDVMNQLDLTFDVFGLPAQGLIELLPKREFIRWLPQT
jgi:hypothetical protein